MKSQPVKTGLEYLLEGHYSHYKSRRAGLICHPASVTHDLKPAAQQLIESGFNLDRLFGPQHGVRGEKQDNMQESASYHDPVRDLPVYSLYGEVRKPTSDMLDGLELLFFDLQDVGVRVYTFIWTMALAMEACAEEGVKFVVLDRPNPLAGITREGSLLKKEYRSFVGLHPIPLRHGLTSGEIARWLKAERYIKCELEVISCEGLKRSMLWQQTGLPWIMPSPNLPTTDSCTVYPGMVLLEGSNLSEGRGTTRPFEIFGAPWLDGKKCVDELNALNLPGVRLREVSFEPTFNKYAGQLCHGAQIHITNAKNFKSVQLALEIFKMAREIAPESFEWRQPPYEYEEKLLPIDMLWGSDQLRKGIDDGLDSKDILAGVEDELQRFAAQVEPYLLYD